VVRAKRVIIAAGCLGTNEILLRSKARGGLPHVSARVGHGFSTNGDYIAFTEGLPYRVNLSRGPVQTCYAHFNDDPANPAVNSQFHIVEDQGIPRALASTVGFGVPLIRSLSNGRHRQPLLLLIWTLLLWAWCRLLSLTRALFQNSKVRQKEFESEDELTENMMCITASGRDQATGVFRLGTGRRDTPLRVSRPQPFHADPIFEQIRATLERLRQRLGAGKPFLNPFLTKTADSLKSKSIVLSHPLGGCPIGTSAADGVVDEFGRVFDATKSGADAVYPGLYVADAAIFPAALGVNPSLTISALALRIGERIAAEMEAESQQVG
jgi:cholesterol oxidase